MAPQLRNMLQRKVIRQIITGVILGFVAGGAWKYGYAEPKKAKYVAYYKDFDADKAAMQYEARLASLGK